MKRDISIKELSTLVDIVSDGIHKGIVKVTFKPTSKKPQKPTPIGKTYRIKRYNCTIVANIQPCNIDGSYSAEILSFIDNKSTYKVGDTIFITNRELELTGTVTGSVKE